MVYCIRVNICELNQNRNVYNKNRLLEHSAVGAFREWGILRVGAFGVLTVTPTRRSSLFTSGTVGWLTYILHHNDASFSRTVEPTAPFHRQARARAYLIDIIAKTFYLTPRAFVFLHLCRSEHTSVCDSTTHHTRRAHIFRTFAIGKVNMV